MKPLIIRIMSLTALLICHVVYQSNAATIDWKGTTSSDWNLAGNWSPAQIPAINDDVRIGVVTFNVARQPTISSGTNACASITIGTLITTATITVDGTLNVTNAITQNPSPSLLAGNQMSTTLAGAGKITCSAINVGNSSGTLSVLGTNLLQFVSTITTLEVSGNVSSYSTSIAIVLGLGFNNAIFSLRGGTTTIGGQIFTSASLYGIGATPGSAKFSIDLPSGALTPVLKLTGATPINTGSIAGSVDFYNYTAGTGTATVEYAGSGQTVYANGEALLNHTPTTYQNIKFSGAGIKNVQAGTLQVGGNWLSDGNTTDPTINLATNAPTVAISGSLLGSGGVLSQGASNITISGTTLQNTGGVFTLGSGTLVFNGSTFTNTGTFTSGTGKVTFGSSGAVSLSTTTLPVNFNIVDFINGNTKTLTTGNFLVANTGILTVSGNTTLAANGNLTLVSDSVSTATLAQLSGTSAITGNVNVQRFVKGSPTSLNKRGYRLISSAVYTGSVTTPTNSKVFDLNYILNSAYVSGMSGGGFNAPITVNPTLYIYRDDIVRGIDNGFTAGNFKGISKINNTNAYDIGTQKKATTANVADTTVNIPVGNGILFFFRGNKTDNATQAGTKVTLPYDYPEDVVFTQTGQINSGKVDVRLWYKTDFNMAYSVVTGNDSKRGFCLLGNPYAATINWEKFNRNSTAANSAIYGSGFSGPPPTIWFYNPSTKQYETYMAKTGTIVAADTSTAINPGTATGSASNMIASGQGFFIKATTATQQVSFREWAKTTIQPTASGLKKLMSMPKTYAVGTETPNSAPEPLLRLKLIKDSVSVDDVALLFNKDASSNYSVTEDAEDMGGNGALVSLSVLSADSVQQAISTLALPTVQPLNIPLMVSATQTGIYQLALTKIANLPNFYEVWLMDSFTGDSLDIRHNFTYNFNLYRDRPASFGNGRFKLVIKQNPILVLQALELQAAKVNSGTKVSWQTNDAFNFTTFNIQKSLNGTDYQAIASIDKTSRNSYSFLDIDPAKGENYYRLMVESADNKISYTDRVMVNYPDQHRIYADDKMVVYPNPVSSRAYMAVKNEDAKQVKYIVNIMNSSGTIVKTLTSPGSEWQYDTSGLLPGTYMVQAVDSKTKKVAGSSKFIKQ
jgi:hypothetical protein